MGLLEGAPGFGIFCYSLSSALWAGHRSPPAQAVRVGGAASTPLNLHVMHGAAKLGLVPSAQPGWVAQHLLPWPGAILLVPWAGCLGAPATHHVPSAGGNAQVQTRGEAELVAVGRDRGPPWCWSPLSAPGTS